MVTATITQSSIKLRNIYIGREEAEQLGIKPGEKYPIVIKDIEAGDLRGTLTASYSLGALSRLYKSYNLTEGDTVNITIEDGAIVITPNSTQSPDQSTPTITAQQPQEQTVFERKKLKHIHIEPYTPGNLSRWVPRTEADVYMVFGALSEFTDYRYCCGASKKLLDTLGYSASSKPDAILIDRNDSSYLVAEVKMRSSDFETNHSKDDIDVLICWEDDSSNPINLPDNRVVLRDILQTAIESNEIEL